MSRQAARRPGLGILAVPTAVVVVVALLAGLGVVDVWVALALVPVAAVVAGLGYVRGLRRFHQQRAEDVERLVATGRWTSFGGQGEPDVPGGVLSFPKGEPLASTVGHTFGGPVLRTRVDGREVWTLELGVQYRSGGTYSETGAQVSGPTTPAEPYHLVLTHLDGDLGRVEVKASGVGDAVRSDVEVGVPEFDRAFTVRTQSERTAKEWLAGGGGADLARQGADALHGGRLRLDGSTLIWWRKGHQDLDLLDDVARLVARAGAFLPR